MLACIPTGNGTQMETCIAQTMLFSVRIGGHCREGNIHTLRVAGAHLRQASVHATYIHTYMHTYIHAYTDAIVHAFLQPTKPISKVTLHLHHALTFDQLHTALYATICSSQPFQQPMTASTFGTRRARRTDARTQQHAKQRCHAQPCRARKLRQRHTHMSCSKGSKG